MIEKCFIASISSAGYVNMFTPELFDDTNFYACNYMPQKYISALVKKYTEAFTDKNIDVRLIYNPISLELSGLILPEFSKGFVSFMPYEKDFFRDNTVTNHKNIINAKRHLQNTYDILRLALEYHDALEKVYIKSINFNELNRITQSLSAKLFTSNTTGKVQGKQYNLFFGATSSKGAFDFLGETIENYKYRYFIKGRAGTGKSTLLKALANKAIQNGEDVFSYHCAFDPESVDMICLKDRSLCVFDSTAPHEYFPNKPSDRVIDIYALLFDKSFDNKHNKEITIAGQKYKKAISEAVDEISKANTQYNIFRTEYSKYYSNKKFKKIENMFNALLSQL